MIQFDAYFFRWVGSTTNHLLISPHVPFETTQDLASSPPLGCPRWRRRTPDARELRAPRPRGDAVAASFSLVAAAGPIATEASGALGVTVWRRWGGHLVGRKWSFWLLGGSSQLVSSWLFPFMSRKKAIWKGNNPTWGRLTNHGY